MGELSVYVYKFYHLGIVFTFIINYNHISIVGTNNC